MNFDKPVIVETGPNPNAAVIWLHGLGSDGHGFSPVISQLNLPETLAVRFVFPHAPVMPVTLNNGFPSRAWFDLYNLSDISREDEAGMRKMDHYIQLLIEEQIDAGISNQRIILAGFSQGGAMALYSGLRYPNPLAGIMGLSTFLAGSQTLAEERASVNDNIQIFLAHGTRDDVLVLEAGEWSLSKLKQLGYAVQWKTYNMGHVVCPKEIADISAFIQECLT